MVSSITYQGLIYTLSPLRASDRGIVAAPRGASTLLT